MTSHHSRRYGRRTPKRARAIQLSRSLTGIVPPHPMAVDYLGRLQGGWQMLGNDVAGDCVPVTWANMRRLMTAAVGAERYPGLDQVWALYKTQNPRFDPDGTADSNGPGSKADGGMDIQTLLEFLVKHGGPDGVKPLGFAQVNTANVEEVKAALAVFGALWTGVNVLDVNQQQFADGQPWDYSRNSPDDGGHSVLTGGYGPAGAGPLGGDERFITWGQETSFTDAFWRREVEEAWVVLWPEHLHDDAFLAGVDLAVFAADYTAVTGRPFPVTVPPHPAPPAPAPTPAPAASAAQVAAAVRDALTQLGV